jgi:endonuclease/exonuclease/phosphatase family metal-dependent hydrolase
MATVCSFNVNNLYVRYRFNETYPGDPSGKSAVSDPRYGYLPMYNPGSFELFNPVQRQLAARALTRDGTLWPDILLLQEVESLIALRTFNAEQLASQYPYALLIDGRDLRQIDVGVLSKLPIVSARTHVDDTDPRSSKSSPWVFSRDCLEVSFELARSRTLTVFLNHFKSKFIDRQASSTPAKRAKAKASNDAKRKRQAQAVVKLLHERFPGAAWDRELFMVAGDLNDEPASPPVAPLVIDTGLENALARIAPEPECWTHWFRGENSVAQLDYMLLSPALAAATAGQSPALERRGISHTGILKSGLTGPRKTRYRRTEDDTQPISTDFGFARFDGVTDKDYASDHTPVFLDIS